MNNYYLDIDNKSDAKVSALNEEAAVAKVMGVTEKEVRWVGCDNEDGFEISIFDVGSHTIKIRKTK